MLDTRRRNAIAPVVLVALLVIVGFGALRDRGSVARTADPPELTVAQLRTLGAGVVCPGLDALMTGAQPRVSMPAPAARAFNPVAAVQCIPAGAPTPTASPSCCTADVVFDTRVDKQVGTVGVGAFVDSLAPVPELGRDEEERCALMGFVEPYIYLVDAQGRAVHPHIPTGECDRPSAWALTAIGAIRWHTV